jgi:hypothetical protein
MIIDTDHMVLNKSVGVFVLFGPGNCIRDVEGLLRDFLIR